MMTADEHDTVFPLTESGVKIDRLRLSDISIVTGGTVLPVGNSEEDMHYDVCKKFGADTAVTVLRAAVKAIKAAHAVEPFSLGLADASNCFRSRGTPVGLPGTSSEHMAWDDRV